MREYSSELVFSSALDKSLNKSTPQFTSCRLIFHLVTITCEECSAEWCFFLINIRRSRRKKQTFCKRLGKQYAEVLNERRRLSFELSLFIRKVPPKKRRFSNFRPKKALSNSDVPFCADTAEFYFIFFSTHICACLERISVTNRLKCMYIFLCTNALKSAPFKIY